jgi:hypothetical protein
VQLCSGHLIEKDGEEVLRAWFEDVAHFHDAPMLYNSAVQREVLLELRRVSGQFFTGASPDIGSGMVLMASLKKFHVLDRPLAVSWFGKWSIGMATVQGGGGAAAAFVSEHRSDPFRDAGLVTCLSGGVAETALACKERFLSLFKKYHINWSTYVQNVLSELKRKEFAGIDVSEDRAFLLSLDHKKYSWLALRMGQLKYRWSSSGLLVRIASRIERLFLWAKNSGPMRNTKSLEGAHSTSNSRPAREDLSAYFNTPFSGTVSFRNVPCFSLPSASSVSDVEKFAAAVNGRLDELIGSQ